MKFRYLIIFLLAHATTYGQQLDSLLSDFDYYRKNALQEKIYAHTDQSFYLTGETMWFKLYVVDGAVHKLRSLSKVAYVEILDRNNFSVIQGKVQIKNGTAHGSFFLPASLGSGHYQFKAYTNWMKNGKPDYFFSQLITIVNPFIQPEFGSSDQDQAQSQIRFFPEGGTLVSGLSSRVAFEITNASANQRGWLINSRNDTVAALSALSNGTGLFEFTPSSSDLHTAVLRNSNGQVSRHPFPKILDEGYVMSVNDRDSIVEVKVARTVNAQPAIFLFVHCRQMIVQASAGKIDNQAFVFSIHKNKLPGGISHFTLFNSDLQPVCERLYYHSTTNDLSLSLQSSQPVFATRRKVRLTVNASVGGRPAAANLSLSVYKADSLSEIDRPGISEYLHLLSDLDAGVKNVDFYRNSPEAGKAIDLLMLTRGWRRFKWQDIQDRKISKLYPAEARAHIVRGNITNADGTPAKSIMAFLASPDKTIRTYVSRSNNNGEISFEADDFFGPRRIIVQTDTRYDSTQQLSIRNPFAEKHVLNATLPFTFSAKRHDQLLDRSVAMQVQDIYHKQEANRFTKGAFDTTAFFGRPDEKYLLDDYTRFTVMEEVMREYVTGVMVRKRKDGFEFRVLDRPNKDLFSTDPLILLDGVPVFKTDEIMAFDPRKIKTLDVMTRKYYLGSYVAYGIVSYTTYEGDLGGFELNPKSLSLNYEGLQKEREFYHPDYSDPTRHRERIPDQRHLLYWNPDVTTNADGSASIEFYSSDLTGNYVVEVEGLSVDGNAGSAKHSFSVKQFNN